MSNRTREASRRIRLARLLEENNLKSPDILTAAMTAKSPSEAYRIAGIFEEATGEDLPLVSDEWRKTLKTPVELYFVFDRKRDQNRFVKMMGREFPNTEVIT